MRAHRFLGTVAAVVTALTCAVALPAAPALAASDETVNNFLVTTTDIPNPGRGFFKYTETHLTGDPAKYDPLDADKLADQRVRTGATLILRYFYLDGYRAKETISSRDLGLIRSDLVAARQAGVKIIARFAYSESSSADAPLALVQSHIRQLAPILNENKAVIAALQAGFVGRWGEWYYSDNFLTDKSKPATPSAADWQARGAVLNTLLDATNAAIPVQVRYPSIKQKLLPDSNTPQAKRVGIHNDCFLAGTEDYGTYKTSADRDWLAAQGNSVLIGGETCVVNVPRTQWPNAAAELSRYHFTYLNADYHKDVLNSWGASGLAEANRRLGYRLRLVQTTAPAKLRTGATGTVKIKLINDGYAAPIGNRPVQLVLKGNGGRIKIAIPADVTTWTPGRMIELVATFTAPSGVADYDLYLNLPDPAKVLGGELPLVNGDAINSAYAIRVANDGTWNAKHGWNDLKSTIGVTK
ncbi:hypothetical protein GCM10010435_16700 [Winogradskya consettensis]|uniref:DUF4832 domain-containing protein n=1 Tax=Winogradskya consettensis TaxID=113560 RepID=A0A919SXF5_9ACTN|nr:DUF4832 domain-containing protein [Actinoplanes consettensis]GIM78813.1 hypothetical protein Aco04nite_62350 [Actinoplanes consettensis]